MTREKVERLIRLFQVAEGQKWQDDDVSWCPFCRDDIYNNSLLDKCLWARVLIYTINERMLDECFPTAEQYVQNYGYTPRRLLEKFLVGNNLARPSKIPGEWDILI